MQDGGGVAGGVEGGGEVGGEGEVCRWWWC